MRTSTVLWKAASGCYKAKIPQLHPLTKIVLWMVMFSEKLNSDKTSVRCIFFKKSIFVSLEKDSSVSQFIEWV